MRNSIKWINQRLSARVNNPRYGDFWDFVLLWNIFEANSFGCNFRLADAKANASNWGVDAQAITETFDYFKSRYVDGDSVNTNFHKLGFRNLPYHKEPNQPTADETDVKDILENSSSSLADMLYANLSIIYRYRNNFFHGFKKLQGITTQKEIFKKRMIS